MSLANPNVSIIAAAAERWNASRGLDHDCWLDIATDDVAFRSIADGDYGMDFTAPCRGHDAVREYFRGLNATFEMIRYNLTDFVAEDDRVVGIGSSSFRSRTTQWVFETPIVIIFGFRDGKICDCFEFYDTAKVAGATG